MGRERDLLLPATILTVAAKVEAQRRHACLAELTGQPGEEAALVAVDAGAVDEDDGTVGWILRRDERPGQLEAVEGADAGVTAVPRHSRSSRRRRYT